MEWNARGAKMGLGQDYIQFLQMVFSMIIHDLMFVAMCENANLAVHTVQKSSNLK